MKWFRWYHGTVEDSKIRLIAKRTGQPKALVLAFWAYLLEVASRADERGQLLSYDVEEASVALDVDNIECLEAIYSEMRAREMIVDSEIFNWKKYQPDSDESGAARVQNWRARKREDNVTLPERYANGLDKTREEQNREEKNNAPAGTSGGFDLFWDAYPRKTAKAYSRRVWDSKKLSSKLPEILRGVEMYKRTEQWKNPIHIPHASTFLNQERWLDDLNDEGKPVGKKPFWQRVKEAPQVLLALPEGENLTIPGADLLWNDPGRHFIYAGQTVYVDQVKVLQA